MLLSPECLTCKLVGRQRQKAKLTIILKKSSEYEEVTAGEQPGRGKLKVQSPPCISDSYVQRSMDPLLDGLLLNSQESYSPSHSMVVLEEGSCSNTLDPTWGLAWIGQAFCACLGELEHEQACIVSSIPQHQTSTPVYTHVSSKQGPFQPGGQHHLAPCIPTAVRTQVQHAPHPEPCPCPAAEAALVLQAGGSAQAGFAQAEPNVGIPDGPLMEELGGKLLYGSQVDVTEEKVLQEDKTYAAYRI